MDAYPISGLTSLPGMLSAASDSATRALLFYPDIKALTTFSKTTLWRKEQLPKDKDPFPTRIRLGPRTVAWDATEVLAWVARRPRGMAG